MSVSQDTGDWKKKPDDWNWHFFSMKYSKRLKTVTPGTYPTVYEQRYFLILPSTFLERSEIYWLDVLELYLGRFHLNIFLAFQILALANSWKICLNSYLLWLFHFPLFLWRPKICFSYIFLGGGVAGEGMRIIFNVSMKPFLLYYNLLKL